MRADVGNSVKGKAGDIVVARCSLPHGCNHARVSVWSAVGDYQLSPHVQNDVIGAIATGGGPNMVRPMYQLLTANAPKHEFRFVADEDMTVQLRQEKDVASEPSVRARIARHGKVKQAFGRRIRDAIGALRRAPVLRLWRA